MGREPLAHVNLDEFTQLNEKFIKARRDYEALLEASMSHSVQPPYNQPGRQPFGWPTGPQVYTQQGVSQPDPQTYYSPHTQGLSQKVYFRCIIFSNR